ncbi:hypothetical protein BN946_scf184960.g4 [Trametes cinnabarina]|uniref:DUF659 domain-containing protein n=1 Tax=Pycnoporus cinnabarinus TaxID=5643 RepID=A0A060SJV6_PYCCI|nr:hypothetical protein BN946_scf184960.g4 [Trametes cinnabarina]
MEASAGQRESLPPGYLTRLRKLLDPQNLPAVLPLQNGPESKYAMFLNFDLDLDILERTEGEVATVSEQFKAVFGWQTRSSGDGIIRFEECSRGLQAAADVLEHFLGKYPGDGVLCKWASDLGAAAEHVYAVHGAELPDPSRKTAQKRRRASSLTASESPKAPAAVKLVDMGVEVADAILSAPAVLQLRKASRGPGRPPKELMNSAITKGIAPLPGNKQGKTGPYWECVSPKCHYRALGNASEARVFRHAATCEHLRDSHPEIFYAIVNTQKNGSLGARISESYDGESGLYLDIRTALTFAKGPAVSGLGDSSSATNAATATKGPMQKKLKVGGTLDAFVGKGVKERKKAERAALQEKVDHTIMHLICVRGLVPSIIDSNEWKELMQILNPDYKPSSCEKFTKEFIPKEAAFVRGQELKEIQRHENITITFDGNNTRRDSIYFVHATTPERKHYFIGGYVGTTERHTVAWVKSKLINIWQSINTIGISRTAAVCSDSTIVTLNTRSEISMDIPTILDLRDCCHHLHNIISDITKLPAFKEPIADMKQIVAHFSKSTFGRAKLQQEVDGEPRLHALQKVGKTRFGSHWTAAQSVLPALPRIRELVQNKEIKFRHRRIQSLFTGHFNQEYTKLELALVQYTAVIEPLIRSLWALESSSTNAADVFLFFTACTASLRDLLATGPDVTGISDEVAQSVINIFNDQYDEFFFHNDVYFAAFALDPRYPVSDYLLIPPTAEPSITVPRQGTNMTLPHPRAYDRMKEFVREALKAMYKRHDDHPEEHLDCILVELGRNRASIELKQQLESYWLGLYPFDAAIGTRSTLAYWIDLKSHPNAPMTNSQIVCIKIFSILVNSMPDERTGSKFTWFNSALRGSQHAQTLVDMVQIGQFYYRQSVGTSQNESHDNSARNPLKLRPTVKFRDINRDLLEAVQHRKPPQSAEEDDSESDSSEDEAEGPTPLRGSESALSNASRLTVATLAKSAAQGEDGSAATAASRSGPVTARTSKLLPESQIDLTAPALLDLLSDKPSRPPSLPTAPANEPSPVPEAAHDVFIEF